MVIPQLVYFKAVANAENYTKAANILHVTQPALSRMISNLEAELGVPLFRKKGRGVELNTYGKILLEHVDIAIDSLQEAEKKINTLISPKTGHIRLASLYTLGTNFTPFLIRDFSMINPMVTFSILQQPTRIQLNMLKNDEIDICFCTDFEGVYTEKEIERTPILIEDLYILVNKKHRLSDRKEVSISELKDEKWIFYNDDTYFKRQALKIFEKVGYYPNIVYEVNEDSSAAGFVAADLGIALVPPIITTDFDKTVPIRISYPICQCALCMAWCKNVQMTPIVAKFKEYTIKWLPDNKKTDIDHYILNRFSKVSD